MMSNYFVAAEHLRAHPSPGLATLSDAEWTEAKRREARIRPLTERGICPAILIEDAAKELGL